MVYPCPHKSCTQTFQTLGEISRHFRADGAHMYDMGFKCPVTDCEETPRSGLGVLSHLHNRHADLYGRGGKEAPEAPVRMPYDVLEEEVQDPGVESESASDMFSRTADNLQLSAARLLLDLLHVHGLSRTVARKILDAAVDFGLLVRGQLADVVRKRLLEQNVPNDADLDLFLDPDSIKEHCKVTDGFLNKVYLSDGIVQPEVVDLTAEEVVAPWIDRGRPLFHTVSIERSLEAFLRHEDVLDEVFKDASSRSNTAALTSYKDGEHFKNHPVFSQPAATEGICIRLRMYSDEVELAKGLSPNCGIHKSYMVYFQVDNVHPRYHSWLDSVHLALMARYPVVKSYGLKRILQPLVEEMKKLAEDGMHVRVKGKRYHFKAVCNFWMADTLAAHPLCGLKASFGGEKFGKETGLPTKSYPCRFCEARHADIDHCFTEADCAKRGIELRSYESLRHQTERIQGGADHKLFKGPNGVMPADGLPYFEPPQSCPPDGMHDVALKVIDDNMRRTLKFLNETMRTNDMNKNVPILKYSTAQTLINSFSYGEVERANTPPPLKDDLLQGTKSIKGSASQRLNMFRNFAFALGAHVSDLAVWKLHRNLLRIVEIIWALIVTERMINELNDLVEMYIKRYRLLFGLTEVFPKLHYLIHYGRMARLYGPWRFTMNWTNEHRHQYFKVMASTSNNFINVTHTLCQRFQEQRCYFLRGVGPILPPQWEAVSKGTTFKFAVVTGAVRERLVELVPEVLDDDTITRYNSVKWEGTLIKRDAYNIVDLDSQNMPVFFRTLQILLLRGQLLVYGIRVPSKHHARFEAYAVKVTYCENQREVVRAERFLPHQTLNHHRPRDVNLHLIRVHYRPIFLPQ